VSVPADPTLRRRAHLVLSLCLPTSLILMGLPLQQKILVADRLSTVLEAPYNGTLAFVSETIRVHGRNLELRSQVAALRLDAAACARLRRQRDELSGALGLVTAGGSRLLPCELVERRLSPEATLVRVRSPEVVDWHRYQPIVTAQGLFGRVQQITGPNTAWVELLTSPGSAVSCEIARNGLPGILEFRDRRFLLTMIGRDEDIRPGDQVVTSHIVASLPGLGLETQRWPGGIPVGTVTAVHASENPLFKEVVVSPAASFSRPGIVFAVCGSGDWYTGIGAGARGGRP